MLFRVEMCERAFFIVIFTLIIFVSHSELALSDAVLTLADRLLESGNYDEAITEYKRFIFFNPECERTGYALYRMGLAHRAGREWQDAIEALRASVRTTKDVRTADERRIILATTLIASGNYSLARLELLRVSEFSEDPSLRLKSLYFTGIAALYMFDWDAAREAFLGSPSARRAFGGFYSDYDDGRMTGRAREIESILLEARQSYKSVGLAKLLSTVIPGAGQMYAGDWRDGVNALMLNGVIIGLLGNAVYRRNPKDAALIFPIFIRYYMGNRYRAEVDVRNYNDSLDRRNAWKVMDLVQMDEP